NRGDFSAPSHSNSSFHGIVPTLHRRPFSISNLRFSDLFAARQNRISITLCAWRTGCRLGGDQLIDHRRVASGRRQERAGGNSGEMESVSMQTVTRWTYELKRWTNCSGFFI